MISDGGLRSMERRGRCGTGALSAFVSGFWFGGVRADVVYPSDTSPGSLNDTTFNGHFNVGRSTHKIGGPGASR